MIRLFWILFLIPTIALGQIGRSPVYSLERLSILYPEKIHNLFENLDLQLPALRPIAEDYRNNDLPSACLALVSYYKNNKNCDWLRFDKPFATNEIISSAESIVTDTFSFQNVKASHPRTSEGFIDWYHRGPNDDPEWGYFLNRHFIFLELLYAYRQSGNSKYVNYFDAAITDWVINNPLPAQEVEDVVWRELEAGQRLANTWPQLFYGFITSEAFSPAAIILMLSSIPDHAEYVMDHHTTHHNWAAMEMNGLATAAVCWPEFKGSDRWFEYASEVMLDELQFQVYPDGVQKELSSSYHTVSLRHFESFIRLARNSYRHVHPEFKATLELMNNYLAYSLRPNGTGPLNNDSDLNDYRDRLREQADVYSRLDWKYIITNGNEGIKPSIGPSFIFPWSGQQIFRSGWEKDAQWGFFDTGPWGISHQHNDKLHFSVHAYGQDLLVDAGRFRYIQDRWRDYFTGSASHNVVLVDEKGQNPTNSTTDTICSRFYQSDLFEFREGTYQHGFGDVSGSHSRAILYLKGKYWLVIDHLQVKGIHVAQPLWHFAPRRNIEINEQAIYTNDHNKANLQIIPLSLNPWDYELKTGSENPVQGWYSPNYNVKVPNTTAVLRQPFENSIVFAWILQPYRNERPLSKPQIFKALNNQVTFYLADENLNIHYNLDPEAPLRLETENIEHGRLAILKNGQQLWIIK